MISYSFTTNRSINTVKFPWFSFPLFHRIMMHSDFSFPFSYIFLLDSL